MDRSYWRAVHGTLLTMFAKGFIYKKEFPVQWCPKCGTALAQAELGYVQKKGKLYHVKFITADGSGSVDVATTRPELLNACQAIAVNPQDGRYSALVGKEAVVPAFANKVRVLADEAVDMAFAQGWS
jgi:valyl-tRNA synthetase